MDTALIVLFPGSEQASRTEVGGKGASLIRMAEAGLLVPPGAVLTTAFFAPWYETLKSSAAWIELAEATPDDWTSLCCSQLKTRGRTLPLTRTQHDALDALLRDLPVSSDEMRFAVRSFSPEEDLTSASFAGLYETRLGVCPDDPRLVLRLVENEDGSLDLRKICEERTRFRKKLEAHVTSFPPVIDSRGRILRPPPSNDVPGLLRGTPVSSGVVTGPVKVLQAPDDKPIEKGDVLVAYTTDPGWTPLFVNAAAIVLEVGGVLQHGAVVAREYGKPCVVGIDRVTEKLRGGETIEVDGAAGTVRILS